MSETPTTRYLLSGKSGHYTLELSNVIKGEKGAPGTAGSNGAKGIQGPKGTAGTNGTITDVQFAFVNNVPQNLPSDGSFPPGWDGENQPTIQIQMLPGKCAYDITNNMLYMYVPGNNTSNWAKFTSPITGPQGIAGTKGDSGDGGAKGEPGAAGTNGSDGSKGAKGDTGAQGLPGTNGSKGSAGPAGATGLSGATGSKGSKGDGGAKGAQGATGRQGETGEKGSKGAAGLNGLSGSKGEKGADASNAGGLARSHTAFNGSGTVQMISEHNISLVTRLSHGKYRVRFGSKLPSLNYCVIPHSNVGYVKVENMGQWACEVHVTNDQGQYQDSHYVSVAVFHP